MNVPLEYVGKNSSRSCLVFYASDGSGEGRNAEAVGRYEGVTNTNVIYRGVGSVMKLRGSQGSQPFKAE